MRAAAISISSNDRCKGWPACGALLRSQFKIMSIEDSKNTDNKVQW